MLLEAAVLHQLGIETAVASMTDLLKEDTIKIG